MSELTPKLNAALVKARADIQNPHFDSSNPHYKNKFASLKSVVNAVIPTLAEHGIAVIQDLQTIDGGVACYTHLCHESGEEKVFGPLVMNATKPDPQGYAAASTYARRYHLMAVCVVVGDEDDDGEAASKPVSAQKSYPKMPKSQALVIAGLVDSANLDTGEGVDAFGEAWIELKDEQTLYAPWISDLYPTEVTKHKSKMREIMASYRERNNPKEEA